MLKFTSIVAIICLGFFMDFVNSRCPPSSNILEPSPAVLGSPDDTCYQNINIKPEDRPEPPNVDNHRNINLLPQNCGHIKSGNIAGSKEKTGIAEYPWMALLQYRTATIPTIYLCGGSIINKNYILTAAHCVTHLPPALKLMRIRVGEHTISNETDCEIEDDGTIKCNSPVQDLNIEEIIPHPNYGGASGEYVNDIALVRVSTINLDVENARPVCLPFRIVINKPFIYGSVMGWGATETGPSSDALQKIYLPIVDKDTCARMYLEKLTFKLHNTQLCAGGIIGRDSCKGDSGGPLVVPAALAEARFGFVQQGIVSFGPKGCAKSQIPGLYTQVKYYMDWILDNMRA